jgi:hypothetical protein
MFLAMKGKDDPTEFMEGEIVAKNWVQSFQKNCFTQIAFIPERGAICFSTKRQRLRKAIPRSMKKIKTVK